MIQLHSITKSYVHKGVKNYIFRDLSLALPKGQSVALLGRNGAGKSTLINLIGGIDEPDHGSITSDCTVSWPVGLVGGFQGSLSARENARFVAMIYCDYEDEIVEKINFVQDFADIGMYFERPFKTYSSGMKARVTFGLSMAFDFQVYLIDEITSVGDEAFRMKCREHLMRKRMQSDFIMVDHNLLGLEADCDYALVLVDGRFYRYDDVLEGVEIHKRILVEPGFKEHFLAQQ
jgi:capsular polysaccharide transport system ATP-binding protein